MVNIVGKESGIGRARESEWKLGVGRDTSRICQRPGMEEGSSSFFYSKRYSSCLCIERVGAHESTPSRGVWKTLFFLAGVLKELH